MSNDKGSLNNFQIVAGLLFWLILAAALFGSCGADLARAQTAPVSALEAPIVHIDNAQLLEIEKAFKKRPDIAGFCATGSLDRVPHSHSSPEWRGKPFWHTGVITPQHALLPDSCKLPAHKGVIMLWRRMPMNRAQALVFAHGILSERPDLAWVAMFIGFARVLNSQGQFTIFPKGLLYVRLTPEARCHHYDLCNVKEGEWK